MKITKEKIKEIILEELTNEGLLDDPTRRPGAAPPVPQQGASLQNRPTRMGPNDPSTRAQGSSGGANPQLAAVARELEVLLAKIKKLL